jgi:protein-tyrosine phosphatase
VLNVSELPDPYATANDRWRPIADTTPPPSLDWLRDNVDFVESARAHGQSVFVHCDLGMSRSALVAVAVLMKEHGWTRDQALAAARQGRPMIAPNKAFMTLLGEWEKSLVIATIGE